MDLFVFIGLGSAGLGHFLGTANQERERGGNRGREEIWKETDWNNWNSRGTAQLSAQCPFQMLGRFHKDPDICLH